MESVRCHCPLSPQTEMNWHAERTLQSYLNATSPDDPQKTSVKAAKSCHSCINAAMRLDSINNPTRSSCRRNHRQATTSIRPAPGQSSGGRSVSSDHLSTGSPSPRTCSDGAAGRRGGLVKPRLSAGGISIDYTAAPFITWAARRGRWTDGAGTAAGGVIRHRPACRRPPGTA